MRQDWCLHIIYMENRVKIESVKLQGIVWLGSDRMTRDRSRTVIELDTDLVDTLNLDKIREYERTSLIQTEEDSNEEITS